jgi:hypothetical protein
MPAKEKKMTKPFTKEEIGRAYQNLLWAQGLIDYVLRMGADMEEAESISIFYILEMLIKDAPDIMQKLDDGFMEYFSLLGKEDKTGEVEE